VLPLARLAAVLDESSVDRLESLETFAPWIDVPWRTIGLSAVAI